MGHVIIAIDSFKGSLSSLEACQIVTKAMESTSNKITMIPIADGGEGTLEAFYTALGGTQHYQTVTGPNGQPVQASFIILPDGTGVIEMAQASGIMQVTELNPWNTTTFGTGELILSALNAGCKRLILGIGGSATNDGGIGMAAALGAKFYNSAGEGISLTGGGIGELTRLELKGLDPRLATIEVIIACDVTNPFYGPEGASVIYGPQKGADSAMVQLLDANLKHLAELIHQEIGINLQSLPGSGAAGGLGGGLVAFAGGRLQSGIELLLQVVSFDQLLETAELVITGEGAFDSQSLYGKVVAGIAKKAKAAVVPVVVLSGAVLVEKKIYQEAGISAAFSINTRPMSLLEAKENAVENLRQVADSLAALWNLKSR
ncbi:MAG: glycerate kinase [Clostridiales bacterium]|jgi:glycerate kinase|nr:glycerate kinase [Clostridiales bacterium]